ncbi:hypothetical protein AWC38_SpisGene13998 [Stylophora pistillata]|uniref:Homeobox domain-containing protein n=1 Tax=Stylophora pistillata TaxID=50429 RepID=A0A2B4RZ45_STYPI|nr:hypothetical protein AWC38_SpisGene13998 [Stylophora pistillata]
MNEKRFPAIGVKTCNIPNFRALQLKRTGLTMNGARSVPRWTGLILEQTKYNVWFKNRRAKYRKEARTCLPLESYESEEEPIPTVCPVTPTQSSPPCFQYNTVPYYFNYSEPIDSIRTFGHSSTMYTQLSRHTQLSPHSHLVQPLGIHGWQPVSTNVMMNHAHIGDMWLG